MWFEKLTKQLLLLILLINLCRSLAFIPKNLDAIGSSGPDDLTLDYDFAVDLASLPLDCYNKEYPYKPSVVLESKEDLSL